MNTTPRDDSSPEPPALETEPAVPEPSAQEGEPSSDDSAAAAPTLDGPPDRDAGVVDMGDDAVFAASADDGGAGVVRKPRRPWYRPRFKPLMLRLHRWMSFVFLIPVVLWFLTGVLLAYSGELTIQRDDPAMYQVTESAHPLTPVQAAQVVQKAFPADRIIFAGPSRSAGASSYHVGHRSPDGVDQVSAVDPGTGRVTATRGPHDTGHTTAPWLTSLMSFSLNLHDCALSCEGLPLYLSFMAETVPVPGTSGTWSVGTVVIVLVGFFTVFLAVSGLVLWWPGMKRWTRGFRLRGRSFYVFNFDLHNVLGFAAIPFLLMWGLTTLTFEIPSLQAAWAGVTGAEFRTRAELDSTIATLAAAEGVTGTEITFAEAEANARALSPGAARVCSVAYPDPDNGSNGYLLEFDGTLMPCTTLVWVNLKGGEATSLTGPPRPWAESFWRDSVRFFHYGSLYNAWWRLLWAFFGLSSVVLIFTGVVMWLRRVRSRRARRARAAGAPGHGEMAA